MIGCKHYPSKFEQLQLLGIDTSSGMPVVLKHKNLNTELGITNGAKGFIRKLELGSDVHWLNFQIVKYSLMDYQKVYIRSNLVDGSIMHSYSVKKISRYWYLLQGFKYHLSLLLHLQGEIPESQYGVRCEIGGEMCCFQYMVQSVKDMYHLSNNNDVPFSFLDTANEREVWRYSSVASYNLISKLAEPLYSYCDNIENVQDFIDTFIPNYRAIQ
ncbi:uncharacterized protein C8R40DRAFT_1066992 [Lentinula edodes]|uniref:uncharacterized protein n=1 Tax=Lentinula edodes TaxID=5353 RepID=UPI001E8D4AAD|nr:uncharacterized protein C8R40DRAFT_1066992 [Lentinula edodes]KAH7878557.1 hypothetical protein C8R40DRAFT_1066992 [Lentinula edodes]